MQGFDTGDTVFHMLDAARDIEVVVIRSEKDEYGDLFKLFTKYGPFNRDSKYEYTSVSKAISDARVAFDLLNDLSGHFELRK